MGLSAAGVPRSILARWGSEVNLQIWGIMCDSNTTVTNNVYFLSETIQMCLVADHSASSPSHLPRSCGTDLEATHGAPSAIFRHVQSRVDASLKLPNLHVRKERSNLPLID